MHYLVKGGRHVNCVCVVENRHLAGGILVAAGSMSELQADFAGWHDTIQQLLDRADDGTLFKWGLFDRAPMQAWGQGRVSLLGDACHPTLPFMAQGAAMAIEDAAVLARCLSADSEKTSLRCSAMKNCERQRTAGVQRRSRRNATVFHMSGIKRGCVTGQRLRQAALPWTNCIVTTH